MFSNVSVCAAGFDLAFQMTVFPACLSLLAAGTDKRKRHGCLCCVEIKPRTSKVLLTESECSIICCTAPPKTLHTEKGSTNSDFSTSYDYSKHGGKRRRSKSRELEDKASKKSRHFFHDIYTPFLLRPMVSSIAIVTYFGYLILCGVLASKIHIGMRAEHTAPDLPGGKPNEVKLYLDYFRDFSFSINVIFKDEIQPYWDADFRRDLDNIYNDLIAIPSIGNEVVSRNWLRAFMRYAEENNFNVSTEFNFIYYLRQHFFREKNLWQDYLFDVKFYDYADVDPDHLVEEKGRRFPRIVASRFNLWTTDIHSIEGSGKVVLKLRQVKQKFADTNISYGFYSFEFNQAEPMLAVSNSLVTL